MLATSSNHLFYLPVEVSGVIPDNGKTVNGIVDTGFNGHLTLPFVTAFPLGLMLVGIEATMIADGSPTQNFLCYGTIKFNGKKVVIPINIQENCPILIGTQLLRKLDHDITINIRGFEMNLLPCDSRNPEKPKGKTDDKLS